MQFMENNKFIISIVALLISLVSLATSYIIYSKQETITAKPTLVFSYDIASEQWYLTNIGNGPAVNIITFAMLAGNEICHPISFPGIGREKTLKLFWLSNLVTPNWGASYSDYLGNKYTSVIDNNMHSFYQYDLISDVPMKKAVSHTLITKEMYGMDGVVDDGCYKINKNA